VEHAQVLVSVVRADLAEGTLANHLNLAVVLHRKEISFLEERFSLNWKIKMFFHKRKFWAKKKKKVTKYRVLCRACA
jgi:hypothetical protein